MKFDKSKWKRKRLKIRDLCPHPDQEELYGGTTTAAEDEALARDLHERGQLDPVHVLPAKNKAELPANTVLDGWRRVNAQKSNGETEVDCVLRHDLVDAEEGEVAIEFANFNFQRRHSSPLARVRCARYLLSSQLGHQPGVWKMQTMKQQVADQLHTGLKTVTRLLAIANAPLAVQQAYDREEIRQVDAARIGTMCQYNELARKQQQELSDRIADGEPAAQVIKEYLDLCETPSQKAKRTEQRKRAASAAEKCLIRLTAAAKDLVKAEDAITPQAVVSRSVPLAQAKEVIERLLAKPKETSIG